MDQPEYWVRGPVNDVPALLQPVAHALLQARMEINSIMENFPSQKLWERPANLASPGFHLKHIPGVLDRLYTYVKGELLSDEQMIYLRNEPLEEDLDALELLSRLNNSIDGFISRLNLVDVNAVTEFRGVGRKQLPSTVLGLLFHCAEHTMRHTGQLLVTVKVIRAAESV